MTQTVLASYSDLAQRITELIANRPSNRPVLLGLVGAPGAGKSTLAQWILAENPEFGLLPMDGFHLANQELDRLSLRGKKGAPRTFDAAVYVNLLKRLSNGESVYAPIFDRRIDESLAGAIYLQSDMPLIVTEGNYLLLDCEPWCQVKGLLDERWYLEIPADVRWQRLEQRHMEFGKDARAAHAWVHEVDEPNAKLIEASSRRADYLVQLS